MSWYNFKLWLKSLSPKRYVATKCGHQTKRTGKCTSFGVSYTMQMPQNDDGSVDYCLDCIGNMAIRCAWCGDSIHIGEPITLYTPAKEDFKIPEYAGVYSLKPLRLIGCLGWDCASSGADRSGFWYPGDNGRGGVRRVASPIEIAFGTGVVGITQDLGSMKEAQSNDAHITEKFSIKR